MTKEDFEILLDSLEIPVAEGINKDNDTGQFPRIVYWEFVWDFVIASSKVYEQFNTYQVSFFSKMPRDPKLIALVKKLLDLKIPIQVQHEYVQDEKYWHSYFSLELKENVIMKNE